MGLLSASNPEDTDTMLWVQRWINGDTMQLRDLHEVVWGCGYELYYVTAQNHSFVRRSSKTTGRRYAWTGMEASLCIIIS